MTHIFPRHTAMRPPRAVAGDGCYIIDSTGKRYLDASGGALPDEPGRRPCGARTSGVDPPSCAT